MTEQRLKFVGRYGNLSSLQDNVASSLTVKPNKNMSETKTETPSDNTPKAVTEFPPINDDLRYILGRVCFACVGVARLLAASDVYEVAPKAEDEQAVVIHWLLTMYFKHGEKWREESQKALDAMVAKLEQQNAKPEGKAS